jgi:glutaredoxin
LVAPACEDKAKSHSATPPAAASLPVITEASTGFLFQYVAPDGTSKEVMRVSDVPSEHRAKVRVIPIGGALPPAGKAFVADLTKAGAGGAYAVMVVALAEFAGAGAEKRNATTRGTESQSAEAQGRERPEGRGAPSGNAEGGVIMYATSWCGVCEKARSYFRRRKIDFVEKDIEKDAAAAAELQRKAAAQGVSARGVPVIDIRGKLLAGFDPQTIERLLAR